MLVCSDNVLPRIVPTLTREKNRDNNARKGKEGRDEESGDNETKGEKEQKEKGRETHPLNFPLSVDFQTILDAA